MRILVTGHLGYIGSNLTTMLRSLGYDVVGIDSGLYAECGFPSSDPVPTLRATDVRDVTASDLAGVNAIIHLAALCNDPLGDLDREVTLSINHRATVRLAELARDAGVERFVFSSSCSIYGAAGEDDVMSEEAPMQPLTPYAESKVRSEEDLSRLAGPSFSPVYLRNSTAYGFSSRLRGDVVLNNLVGWANTTGTVTLMSNGQAWRPLVHIDDIARACVACLRVSRELIHDQAINIGRGDENYRVSQLAEIVRDTVPGCRIVMADDAAPDTRSYRVDFGKAGRVLAEWRPTWTASLGAAEVACELRERGVDKEAFFSSRFMRLLEIKRLLGLDRLDRHMRMSAVETL